jgi:hypothetical protein
VTAERIICVPCPEGWLELPESVYREHLRERIAPAPEVPAAEAWISVEQLAEATGYPISWLGERARRGELPSQKVGKYRRYRLADALRYLEQQSAGRGTGVRGS